MLNKYKIGDHVIYKIEGKEYHGEIHEIKAQTRRFNATSAREGYSVILWEVPLAYMAFGTSYRIQEKDILGFFTN